MPRYDVIMYDYVRIDCSIEGIEAADENEAWRIAEEMINDGDDRVMTENTWDSMDDMLRRESITLLED